MAATAVGRRLTEAHRLAQSRLGAQVVSQMLTAWRLIDPANVDASVDRWLRVSRPIVVAGRTRSAALASTYVRAFRQAEIGEAFDQLVELDPLSMEAIDTSLLVTGPITLKTATRRSGIDVAISLAAAAAAAAAMRHALSGGRDMINNTVEADGRALGYFRVTSGSPCSFCAMLASRGPVYKSEQSASRRADGRKYHDDCQCGVEPVYREDAAWPPGSRRFRELWNESTLGLSGKDARNAFRRAFEAA